MSSFDYMSAFRKKKFSRIELIKNIDSLLSSDSINVRAIPFGCNAKNIDWLIGNTIGDRHIKLLWKTDNAYSFELNYKYKEDGKEQSGVGSFFVIKDDQFDDVFIAVTIDSSKFYNRALLPLIKSLYPRVLLTFITHKKLRRLIETFKEIGNYDDLVITRASQRLRFQEDQQNSHVIPVISWPETNIDEAFKWVYEQNGWFESISFNVKQGYRSIADITFTRKGIIKANSQFELISNSFIKSVCKTIHENLELFSHRARLERSDLSTRPIVINFEEDQFNELSENQRFIKSMKRLKTSSVSVLHGNPYVHLSVLDYLDGSAFDLWILDNQQLVLVPQLKATIASIKRLINHVFDNYAEGSISNYSEAR